MVFSYQDTKLQIASASLGISFLCLCIFAYRFLVKKREVTWLNQILRLNFNELINEVKRYQRQSMPDPENISNIDELLENAYCHPCEKTSNSSELVELISKK